MMRQDLQSVVLVCPDNDAESRMILLIAYRLGMCVIRSGQAHGATLERERGDIYELILATGRREVWIVEMPGPSVEWKLFRLEIKVIVIDHHTYQDLDRSKDANGRMLSSSLAQFLEQTGVDDELVDLGFSPKVVHGVGIMDARFVQGLREAKYSHKEICEVLDFRRDCARAGNPNFDRAEEVADIAWVQHATVNGYIVVSSTDPVAIRGAVCEITIRKDCDTRPLIISDMNGAEIFVQNVDPAVVELLQSAIPEGFTFGSGRCWGVNNRQSRTNYTLDHILGVLS